MLLYLLSNSSKDYFPENKRGNFRVMLPHPLLVPRGTRACLSKMYYPKTFLTFTSKENKIVIELGDAKQTIELWARVYHTAEELIKEINAAIKRKKGIFDDSAEDYVAASWLYFWHHITFDLYENGKIKLQCYMGTKLTVPSEKLRAILGMPTESIQWGDAWPDLQSLESHRDLELETIEDHTWSAPVNVHAGDSSLLIYTDLVKPQIVSDVYSPLLGIATTKHDKVNFGELVTYEPAHLVYAPLRSTRIENVNIVITDIAGNEVEFQSGNVIVVLDIQIPDDADAQF